MYKIGIDTGGTNTDIVMTNIETGEVYSTKTPTTPANLIEGINDGINKIVSIAQVNSREIKELIYGTTIVVNMIAQKEAEATALITTKGFRDVLEIGRAYRDKNIYDIYLEKPSPLVKRDLRYEVNERINFQGDIIEPLNRDEVKEMIKELKLKGIKSIAVCLLHSYVNPVHERMIKEAIIEEWPEVYVSISSDINPQFREYERTSTTVINAYMMPNMVSHLVQFEKEMNKNNLSPKLYIMQGNAGVMTFRSAVEKPVKVADSGPIAGIIAANYLGKMAGIPNIITLDMGGTSCDVSLIQHNTLKFTTDSHIEGYPINIPTVDLDFIGAGGGSIAWCDQGGALKVGPLSAGALPGPVCYGRGGTEPTVTDANLVTGRIRPEIFLEDLTQVMGKTREAIHAKIARVLGMEVLEAAEGILEVVNANMIRAIKLVSVERGYDPREFALVAFGGAGALHAGKLAEEMEIPKVVIPYSPGTFSALGLVLADIKHDYVYTKLQTQELVKIEEINEIYAGLDMQGLKALEKEGVPSPDRMLLRTCDIRYFGQAYELSVPIPNGELNEEDIQGIAEKFHKIHEQNYGHAMRNDPIELVNYRVSAIGSLKKPNLGINRVWETGMKHFAAKSGKAVFDGQEYLVPIIDRNALAVGVEIQGPAIIGEMGSTIVVYPGQKAAVDQFKNVIIFTASSAM